MKIKSGLEDSSSQAGWMFADLFLALTVIFLATVSFIPQGTQGESKSQGTSTSSQDVQNGNLEKNDEVLLISNGFIGEYSVNDRATFVRDLNDYMTGKGLPNSTSALYLEVIGHTTEYGTPNDNGNLDALKFVIELRKLIPNVLEGTNTSINLSPDVAPKTVRVKLTFT